MELNSTDKQRLQTFYGDALKRFGPSDVRSVQWTSEIGQRIRFDVLSNIGDIVGASILDVGCGVGEMYQHFLDREIPVSYTGIDIIPEFIDAAEARFPDARFFERNILDETERFDYIFASGALSFRVENNSEYVKSILKKMYDLSYKGVAFNMLMRGTHINNETYVTYHPEEVADFCEGFAERVEIVTDYLPQDFTVYVYK